MSKFGNTVRLLSAGKVFGERALFSDGKRQATIVIDRQDTELLMLHKE